MLLGLFLTAIAVATCQADQLEYDFVIVGGGTAGLALASRLSRGLPESSILVLEAGPDAENEPRINIPAMRGSAIASVYDWNFTTVPQPHAGNRSLTQPRGKVLGGSSALNFMSWDRASKVEYDIWGKLGNEGWNWSEMMRSMLKVGGNSLGSGFQPSNVRYSDRKRSYSAHHPGYPSLAGPNLQIRVGKRVRKIDLVSIGGEDLVATGVTLEDNTTVLAIKEVILAAGTMQSPGLLELSGVGQKDVLHAADVQQLVDLPGVGENLQDHLRIQNSYRLLPNYTSVDMLKTNATFAKQQLEAETSPLHGSNFFTLIAVMLHPFSTGSIHVTSPLISTAPQIQPNYLSHGYDIQALASAAKYLRKLASTAPLRQAWTEEYEPGLSVVGDGPDSDSQWREYAINNTETIFHPVGTCAMLPRELHGVVNANLTVYGTDNLRVVDASVMPVLISGHIQTAVYGIAEKAAEMIIKRWQ